MAPLFLGCGHSPVAPPSGYCRTAAVDSPLGAVAVRRASGRPPVALVMREGDPRQAVSAWIVAGGSSAASTALAALLEARLRKAGLLFVDSRVDRDSLRLRALVENDDQAGAFVAAVRKALATPIAVGDGELTLVGEQLEVLKRHPLDAPILASIAACTGELGALASEPSFAPTTPQGVAELEAVRVRSYGAARVAFGAVGGRDVLDEVVSSLQDADAWPLGGRLGEEPRRGNQVGAFAAVGQSPGTAQLTVAFATKRGRIGARPGEAPRGQR